MVKSRARTRRCRPVHTAPVPVSRNEIRILARAVGPARHRRLVAGTSPAHPWVFRDAVSHRRFATRRRHGRLDRPPQMRDLPYRHLIRRIVAGCLTNQLGIAVIGGLG